MRIKSVVLTLVLINFGKIVTKSYTPIVLWHGVDDPCCTGYVGNFMAKLNETLPGIYMYSLQIGLSVQNDLVNGFFLHPNKQIETACRLITTNVKLRNGFNAIGFSQGSQFMRGLIQKCPKAKVKNFISIGGQHQGVYGIPRCLSQNLPSWICDAIRKSLNDFAYDHLIQDILVQATYWHDPLHENEYKNGSTFLADINNENTINAKYVERLQSLDNFVMVKFLNDSMVEPIESSWFGFYKPGQAEEVEELNETKLFTEDRLGLQKMSQQSKLHFYSVPGDHVIFEWSWFEKYIVPFLSN